MTLEMTVTRPECPSCFSEIGPDDRECSRCGVEIAKVRAVLARRRVAQMKLEGPGKRSRFRVLLIAVIVVACCIGALGVITRDSGGDDFASVTPEVQLASEDTDEPQRTTGTGLVLRFGLFAGVSFFAYRRWKSSASA